jgi:membrane protein
MSAQQTPGKHRDRKPGKIPKPGWKEVLKRTKNDVGRDNLSIVAGGVAFYMLLAIFPGIGAMVAIYGLVADPVQIQQQLSSLAGILPQEALSILQSQLSQVASGSSGMLGIGAIFGILLALWSAAKGMKAFITGLNIVYDEEDQRSFIKLNAIALGLTLGAIVFVIISLGLIVIFPVILNSVGLRDTAGILVSILRWPLLTICVILAVGLLYRYAPHRNQPQFRWVSWGAVIATVLWIVASILFSFYVRNFGSYNETYGSIGAVIILLMWFYITAFVILLGAELNSEMEQEPAYDTTRHRSERRGAQVAGIAGRRTASQE